MFEKKWIIKSKSPSTKENFFFKTTDQISSEKKINWVFLIILIVILVLLIGFFVKKVKSS
jgi:hypothetical protein